MRLTRGRRGWPGSRAAVFGIGRRTQGPMTRVWVQDCFTVGIWMHGHLGLCTSKAKVELFVVAHRKTTDALNEVEIACHLVQVLSGGQRLPIVRKRTRTVDFAHTP